jgi:hypothetical protein
MPHRRERRYLEKIGAEEFQSCVSLYLLFVVAYPFCKILEGPKEIMETRMKAIYSA